MCNQTGETIQCVPTDKDLVKLLILRQKLKTATKLLMVSTFLNVLEFHHNKLFDI